jgi:hypothetical protein
MGMDKFHPLFLCEDYRAIIALSLMAGHFSIRYTAWLRGVLWSDERPGLYFI